MPLMFVFQMYISLFFFGTKVYFSKHVSCKTALKSFIRLLTLKHKQKPHIDSKNAKCPTFSNPGCQVRVTLGNRAGRHPLLPDSGTSTHHIQQPGFAQTWKKRTLWAPRSSTFFWIFCQIGPFFRQCWILECANKK